MTNIHDVQRVTVVWMSEILLCESPQIDIDGTNEQNKQFEESETAQRQTERFLGSQPARITEAPNLVAIPSVAVFF